MNTLPFLAELWSGFLHLLFPELCVACGGDLPGANTCFCFRCRANLAPTDMHFTTENDFVKRLWGRLNIISGAAAYYYTKQSPIRNAVHELKYGNQPQIGLMLGREFGQKLRLSDSFKVDVIVPVPLHPKKERARGYNQSTVFAQGLSEAMDVPVMPRLLSRQVFTETQTKKKRMERFQNVGEVFRVSQPNAIRGKHILLVDDVLTTGATLEVCGQAILEVPNTQLSCATIAIASR